MRAAITGHLVFSTLHTNDAVSAVYRLKEVGVEPWLVASALRGVVSQRLLRKVCPHCKKGYQPSAEELALLGMPEDSHVTFYKGEGCPECHHSGYTGRRAAFEILMLSGRLRRLISEGANEERLTEEARKNGITKTALNVVGDFLGENYERSKLYDPAFTTEFRQGTEAGQ